MHIRSGLRLALWLSAVPIVAAVAAQGRNDVHAMIAFAPVIKVSSYLREIRALSLARSPAPPPPTPSRSP